MEPIFMERRVENAWSTQEKKYIKKFLLGKIFIKYFQVEKKFFYMKYLKNFFQNTFPSYFWVSLSSWFHGEFMMLVWNVFGVLWKFDAFLWIIFRIWDVDMDGMQLVVEHKFKNFKLTAVNKNSFNSRIKNL